MSIKTLPVSFRLPPATKMAMEDIARKDARSLSSLLEIMCNEVIARQGDGKDKI